MKKIIYALITICVFGCSPGKEEQIVNDDFILGKWKLTKEIYYNSSNNTSIERMADNCESLSSTEYNSNNTISFISYEANGISSCTLQPNNWEYAKWQNLGNSNYKFTSKISGQSEEISNNNIQFQNSNTLILKGNSNGNYNGQPFNYSEEYYTKI